MPGVVEYSGTVASPRDAMHARRVADTPMPFGARIWFAWACFFRILGDGAFASRAQDAVSPQPHDRIEGRKAPEPEPVLLPKKGSSKHADADADADVDGALQLLSLLQREGRFVDFVEQELGDHPDSDVGAAARVVHEGCRKALRGHVKIEPIRTEDEGSRVELAADFDRAATKLTGDVAGDGPYKGTLRVTAAGAQRA